MAKLYSIIKWVTIGILFTVSTVNAAQYNAPQAEGEGEIQSLNFGASEMVVNGYIYDVSATVRVEIGGTFGAFTMLEEGMLIEFDFLRFDDGVRQIVTVREVAEIEEY